MKQTKVLLMGDSISKGVVFDAERKRYFFLNECFAGLLGQTLSAQVDNCGRFGATVKTALSKLPEKLASDDPDVVVLEYGGNDCDFNWKQVGTAPEETHLPKVTLQDFKADMASMIQMVKGRGKLPLLTTLPPIDSQRYFRFISGGDSQLARGILTWLRDVEHIYRWQESYSNAMWELAVDEQVPIVDVRSAFLKSDCFPDLLCEDGIHPNAKGHELIYRTILQWIETHRSILPAQA